MPVNDGSKVGMMDPAYFVGKKILLEWINGLLKLNLKKIEETCTGAIACQILQSIFPGKVPMSKVNFGAKYDYEYVKNYKVLQNCFGKLNVSKHVPVDKLVRGKYQDNLEFMQWFKSFYDLNGGAAEDYDAVEARARSKNVPKPCFDTPSSSASSAPARRRPATRKAVIKETTKENKTSGRPAARKKAANSSSQDSASNAKLQEANEKLVRQVASLKIEVESLQNAAATKEEVSNDASVKLALDGLEKERDFYFKKLRDIEVYLQELGEPDELEGPAKDVVQKVFGILYATDDDDFEAPAAVRKKVACRPGFSFLVSILGMFEFDLISYFVVSYRLPKRPRNRPQDCRPQLWLERIRNKLRLRGVTVI